MVRRACFGVAATLIALAAVAPVLAPASAQDDPEAGRPTAFVASAEAYGSQQLLNTVPPQFVSELINVRTPWVNSQFEAGSTSTGTASLFDPGALVTNGASLMCQFSAQLCAIPSFPPPYPLTARGSYPLATDATAQVNGDTVALGPVSTTGGDAKVHAGRDEVRAESTVQGNALGSGGAVLVKIGNSTSTNRLHFEGGGTLVAEAVAAVNDVTVLGLLHIDSIEARSTSASDASGALTNDVHLDIHGATLAGVPVTIDDKGLTLGPSGSQGGGVLGTLGKSLDPLLSAFRGSVRTLGTTDVKDSSGATASASGLVVELFPNTDAAAGVSPRVTVLLAFAGSHAYAFDPPPFSGGSSSSSGSSSTGSSSTGSSSGTAGRPATPAVNVPGRPAATPAADGGVVEQVVGTLLGGAAADRLKLFYLAWTLSMIGCALGSRLNPARLSALATSGGNDGQRR